MCTKNAKGVTMTMCTKNAKNNQSGNWKNIHCARKEQFKICRKCKIIYIPYVHEFQQYCFSKNCIFLFGFVFNKSLSIKKNFHRSFWFPLCFCIYHVQM